MAPLERWRGTFSIGNQAKFPSKFAATSTYFAVPADIPGPDGYCNPVDILWSDHCGHLVTFTVKTTSPPTTNTNQLLMFLLQTGTALGVTDENFDFAVADWDGDGRPDLIAIQKSSTGTNSTEVHIVKFAPQVKPSSVVLTEPTGQLQTLTIDQAEVEQAVKRFDTLLRHAKKLSDVIENLKKQQLDDVEQSTHQAIQAA